MMLNISDKYNAAALSLLAVSALFIAIALLLNLGALTTAALVMAGDGPRDGGDLYLGIFRDGAG